MTIGVFLDSGTVDWGDIDIAPLAATLPTWRFYPNTEKAQRAERLAGAHVVVSNKVPIDADLLDQCPGLRLICAAATGVDHIDVKAAEARGIAVRRAPTYAAASVVQHTISLLLALTGHLVPYIHAVRAGEWSRSPFFCLQGAPPVELAGKVLGILGYGTLGQGVHRVASALGMEVWIGARNTHDTRPGRVPLADLLAGADVLTLHSCLTPENTGCIDAAAFAKMKRGAYLINTARGGLVVESALVNALYSGHLAGAAIDVCAQEPLRADHPFLTADLPNLILTPHIAWATQAARQRLIGYLAAQLEEFFK